MEHCELIEGASVNYLAELMPDNFLVYPGENNLDKSGQRIVCYVEGNELGEEDPPNSGNRWGDVVWQLRTPFSKLTGKEKAAGEAEVLDSHKAAANDLQAAVLALDDEKFTAAIPGFTCWGIVNRTQIRDQEENGWVSGWRIRFLSCPAAFPN